MCFAFPRMWTKGNIKVGREIGRATMGNRMEVPQKKIVLSYDPGNSTII